MLGRTAAVLAGQPRPIIVHTYHGHVLEGYFGPARNALYRGLERRLAAVSDALIGVSTATVDDLVRLGVAPRERFRVIPIGLELDPFLAATPADGAAFRPRRERGPESVLLTFVGRLAPIKRVDVLLRAFAHARDAGAPVRLAIVGDGGLRAKLEGLARSLGVRPDVCFAGYRADMVPVAAASDIAVLSSDNEGTPVSLIEAAAAGTRRSPRASGGVADVVTPDTGSSSPPATTTRSGGHRRARLGQARSMEMGARARTCGQQVLGGATRRRRHALYDELLTSRAIPWNEERRVGSSLPNAPNSHDPN